jgi:hypothetical protein
MCGRWLETGKIKYIRGVSVTRENMRAGTAKAGVICLNQHRTLQIMYNSLLCTDSPMGITVLPSTG